MDTRNSTTTSATDCPDELVYAPVGGSVTGNVALRTEVIILGVLVATALSWWVSPARSTSRLDPDHNVSEIVNEDDRAFADCVVAHLAADPDWDDRPFEIVDFGFGGMIIDLGRYQASVESAPAGTEITSGGYLLYIGKFRCL